MALFRFDESGGTALYNTAVLAQKSTPKVFIDASRTKFEWVHYLELDANKTFDNELQRNFLFCLEPHSRRVYKHCECKISPY